MATRPKRKVYDPELKARIGIEALQGEHSIGEIARRHGIHAMQIRQWRKRILDAAGTLFDVRRGPKPRPEAAPARYRQALCCNLIPACVHRRGRRCAAHLETAPNTEIK